MLRLTWRELETGHFKIPRQFSTLPDGKGLETDHSKIPRQSFTRQLFHKKIKMFLGFEDVATKSFDSVASHVHWVYCAYILLHSHPPDMPKTLKSIDEKQQMITVSYKNRQISSMLQLMSQFNGVERLKKQLREALEPPEYSQSLI